MGRPGWTTGSGGWLAMVLGVGVEGAALWLFELLPTWAQVAVLAPPVALFVAGLVIILRDRAKRRAMKQPRRSA